MPRTTEEKIILSKKFIDSKMSKRAFCQKYKVSCRTLNNYLAAFDKPIDGMNPPLKYIELPPEVEAMPNPIQNTCSTMIGMDVESNFALEINGVTLQIPGTVTAEYLGSLLKVVAANV